MNNFCEECPHSKIPSFIKDKFNNEIRYTFIDCPSYDKKVVHCFIREYDIDWGGVIKYLMETEKLNSKELKLIEKEGEVELRKRGEKASGGISKIFSRKI